MKAFKQSDMYYKYKIIISIVRTIYTLNASLKNGFLFLEWNSEIKKNKSLKKFKNNKNVTYLKKEISFYIFCSVYNNAH